MGYKASNGYAVNPMLKYPRNAICFCGKPEKKTEKLLKFKKCCLPRMSLCIPIKDAIKLRPVARHARNVWLGRAE